MKCAAIQKTAGFLCCALLLQCAGGPGRGQGHAGDDVDVAAAIDRGEDIVLYADLSLQQLRTYLNDARNIAVDNAFEKSGGGCAAYLPALERIIAAVTDARYGGIPLLDSSDVAWPGVVRVRLGGGDTVAVQLPAVTPVVLGVMEMKRLCLNRDDGGNEKKHRPGAESVSFGAHIEKIDSLIDRVTVERGKMKLARDRLQFERALLRITRERSPAEALARDVSGRIERARGALADGATEGERTLLEYELLVLREEMERVRSYQHPERHMRSEENTDKRSARQGEKER